jgi:hypothetical protein
MAPVANGNSQTLASRAMPRRFDNLFFIGMALLIMGTVFLGFAKTYFLAGVFRAPLPNLLIHIHGAAFTCWMLLLITQISLVSAGRVDIHRKLGIVGFSLACLMVVLGTLAAANMLARGEPPFADAKAIYAVTLLDMVLFATMVTMVLSPFGHAATPAATNASSSLLPSGFSTQRFADGRSHFSAQTCQ